MNTGRNIVIPRSLRSLSPELAAAHLMMEDLVRAGLPGRALDYADMLAKERLSCETLMIRGDIRALTGDGEGALEDYGDGLLLDGMNPHLLYRRGRLHYEKGRTERALDDFLSLLGRIASLRYLCENFDDDLFHMTVSAARSRRMGLGRVIRRILSITSLAPLSDLYIERRNFDRAFPVRWEANYDILCDCGHERTCRNRVIFPPNRRDLRLDEYLENGYCRVRCMLLKVLDCDECLSIRIDTERFHPGKTMRRILRKNGDITVIMRKPSITMEKIRLFADHQRLRHGMDESIFYHAVFLHQLMMSFPCTVEADYYLGKRLVAVGVLDIGRDSLYDNIFFYDDIPLMQKRRLGIFSMLKHIGYAASLGKRYLYPAWYNPGLSRHAYKVTFRPCEMYLDGKWVPFRGSTPVRPPGGKG